MRLESLAQKVLPVLLFLYALSLLVSMAGMEIFSWTTAALVLVVAIFQIIQHRQSIGEVFLFADFALFALLVVIILGALFTAPPSPPAASTIDIIGSARWIVLFYLLRLALHWSFHDNAQYAFNFLLTVAGIVGIYAIIQHFTGIDIIRHNDQAVQFLGNRDDGSAIYRSAGFFSGPMRFGNSYGLLVFFPIAALITIKHKSKLFKSLMIFSALFISLGLVTTMVRGVWLGVIVGIIVMSMYVGRRKAFVILAGLLTVLLGVGFGVESVRHRVAVAANNLSFEDSRVKIWRANIEMFKDHPILGVGNNQNEAIIGDYYTKMNITDGQIGHAHNTYLQFLSGTGILGFLCYMIFILYFLFISHRLLQMIPERFEWHRSLVLGAIGAQIFLHVGGLTEPSFKHAEVKHMFLFILAVVATLYCKYRNEHTLLIRRPANEGPGHHGV